MRLLKPFSSALAAVVLLSGCGILASSGADEARELAVETMSTVPLPADYVLIEDESIVEDMDTNAFTRQTGSINDYWETDIPVEADNFLRIDEALVDAGFRRYQIGPTSACGGIGIQIGYARQELDFELTHVSETGKVVLYTNFSELSADYNHLSTLRDWLDELPPCALEGVP